MYAKLFRSFLDSTLWMEDDHVVRVWIAMLLLCDSDGYFTMTLPGIANRARVTMEQCEQAVSRLESPDRHSSTPDEEGRRIVRISDDGPVWHLVNYEKYRKIQNESQRKEHRKQYMRDYRARKKAESVTSCNSAVTRVTGPCPQGEGDGYGEGDLDGDIQHHSPSADGRRGSIPFDEFWSVYPRRDAKKRAASAWRNLTVKNQRAAMAALPRHVAFWAADGRTRKTTPLPTTWINGERWNDEIEPATDDPSETDSEWLYDTYRRADHDEHKEHELWPMYLSAVAGLEPRTAPTFAEWVEGGLT